MAKVINAIACSDIYECKRSIRGCVSGQRDGPLLVHGDVRLREPRAKYPLRGPLQLDTRVALSLRSSRRYRRGRGISQVVPTRS